MNDISACIIVKNEENNIERCLNSIKDHVDEIVILDTGSTDDTIKICRKYTDNIYYRKWDNNFSDARNYCISKATKKWIFIIDADEELKNVNNNDIKQLIDFIERKNYKSVSCLVRNYLKSDKRKFVDVFMPRLFLKNTISYRNSVHNQPSFDEPILYDKKFIRIDHYGYIWTKSLIKSKIKRSYPLIENEIKNNEEKLYYFGQLMKFNVSSSNNYLFYKNKKDFFRILKKEDFVKNTMTYEIIYDIISYLKNNNEYKEFEEIFNFAEEYLVAFPDIYLLKIEMLYKEEKFNKVLDNFDKFILSVKKLEEIRNFNFSFKYKSEMFNFVNVILNSYDKRDPDNFSEKKFKDNLFYIINIIEDDKRTKLIIIKFLRDKFNIKYDLLKTIDEEDFFENIFGRYSKIIKNNKLLEDLLLYYYLYNDINFKKDFIETTEIIFEKKEYIFINLILLENILNLLPNSYSLKVIKKMKSEDKFNKYFSTFIYHKNKFYNESLESIIENKSLLKSSIDSSLFKYILDDLSVRNEIFTKFPYTINAFYKLSEIENINNIYYRFDHESIEIKFLDYLINNIKEKNYNIAKIALEIYNKYNLIEILIKSNLIMNEIGLKDQNEEKMKKNLIMYWDEVYKLFENPELETPKYSICYFNNHDELKKEGKIKYILNNNIDFIMKEVPYISVYKENENYIFRDKVVMINDNKFLKSFYEEFQKKINEYINNNFYLDEKDFKYNIEKSDYGILSDKRRFYPELESEINDNFCSSYILFPEFSYDIDKLIDFIINQTSKRIIIFKYKKVKEAIKNPLTNYFIKNKFLYQKSFTKFDEYENLEIFIRNAEN
jgi:glycosyltransferase involved in cell wall biosynthesis